MEYKIVINFIIYLILFVVCQGYPVPDGKSHIMSFQGQKFILDGASFKFAACEIHYPRIPKAYWQHRLQMSKALGCNVISAYVFWNYHELSEGIFDWESDNRNLGEFLSLAASLKLWVFIRPGPYVCAEWDAGGHPSWLLKNTSIVLRSNDPTYVYYATRYINNLASVLRPHQSRLGGNILMLQIENEYGYHPDDPRWPQKVKDIWDATGLRLPYYQAEPVGGVAATHLQGVAIGINPGINETSFQIARSIDPNVPIFSSETWLGWFTHWGDDVWGSLDLEETIRQVSFLVNHDYSFSIYMAHGGTSFGFWSGANYFGHYVADISSYDYDCPINEAGQTTDKFWSIRSLIQPWAQWEIPDVPAHPGFIDIPSFTPTYYTNILAAFQQPGKMYEQPQTFEQLDQPFGLIAYVATVQIAIPEGKMLPIYIIKGSSIIFNEIHDYAQVYIDNEFLGYLDRRLETYTLKFNKAYKSATHVFTILVEALGRINFDVQMFDQKGIIGKVSILTDKSIEIKNWIHYRIPLSEIPKLTQSLEESQLKANFFKHSLNISMVGDIYLDMSLWKKGYVWINGYNLGRFWNIGPQTRLYVPGPLWKVGSNEILVLDLESSTPQLIWSERTLR